MQLFEYALNIICASYAQPFMLYLFLGQVPDGLNYDEPDKAPSWFGQEYIFPQGSSGGYGGDDGPSYGGGGGAGGAGGYDADSISPHNGSSGARGDTVNIPLTTTTAAVPLPDDFLSHAVRASRPLTRVLTERLHHSDRVCAYLAKNLNWRVVSLEPGARSEIPIDEVPLRVWVTRTPARRPFSPPDGPQPYEILWDATLRKPGGLQQGELPQVEPKVELKPPSSPSSSSSSSSSSPSPPPPASPETKPNNAPLHYTS